MKTWKIITTTIKGKVHVENSPCQDSVYGYSSEESAIIALSDGAGSATLSHIGSKIVVNTFAGYIRANFDEIYRNESGHFQIIERIKYNLHNHSRKLQTSPTDYSSTLIGLAIKGNRYFFIHIGDGVAGFENSEGLHTLSQGMHGEFANETYFITSKNIENHAIVKKGELEDDIRAFFIMSDGAGRLLYDKRKNEFAPAVVKILEWMEQYDQKYIKRALVNSLKNLPSRFLYDDFSVCFLKRC